MFTKISNSIGIEADEVEAIHEKWQFDKVRDSMMETDRAFKEKTSEKSWQSVYIIDQFQVRGVSIITYIDLVSL